MMAILDTLASHYNIDQSNVFCTGVSMGGFMSHRMAIEHGDRIKAIVPVCGTIGTKTVLIKVNDGEHEWCHGPYRDVDFTDEIYNFFASCLGNVPTVTTTDIAATTATFGGEVTAEGSAAVTARGVCWSTSPRRPTIANLHTTDSVGTGSFISILTDLTPNTTYYARAYATNEVGTAYSDEVIFTTLCDYSPKFNP